MGSFIEFIGRFHPVLVHLPIGFLLVGLLLIWLRKKQSYGISLPVIRFVILWGMFAAIAACLTGTLLSLSGDYDVSLVSWHMWMGFGVAIASMYLYMKLARQELDNTYKALSVSLVFFITITGHLGGSLTHGSDYLTSALSGDEDSVITIQKPIVNVQEAMVYEDVINPLFQSKCISCHGPKKEKGKFRMDDPVLLMKGGKNGPEIVPANVAKSELMKRILLPENEEHHMPPKEKPQLNERQVALLHWWIDQGAHFNKKVKDIPQPDKIKQYLLALQTDQIRPEKKAVAIVPSSPVEAADEKAILALREKGVLVLPVSQNSNYLSANFINAPNISAADLGLLKSLQKQLVWLKMGNTAVNDSALALIAGCKQLTSLQLNHTGVTDKGLALLKSLENLQYLNLVGTRITAGGILQLQGLKKLESLFLFQSGVARNDWEKLRTAFPKTAIDTGGYQLQFLETDTMVVVPPPVKQ